MTRVSQHICETSWRLVGVQRVIAFALVACLAAAAGRPVSAQDDRPFTQQPYIGISTRNHVLPEDQGTRCIVSWLYPGPVVGTGFNSKYMQRGDFILAVNGQDVATADEFTGAINRLSPGDTVELRVQYTDPPETGALPTPGTGTRVETVTILLASRADWVGPVSRVAVPNEERVPEALKRLGTEPTALEVYVDTQVDAQGLNEPIDALKAYFEETLNKNYGINMLSYVAYGFHHPTRLNEIQKALTEPMSTIARKPSDLTGSVRQWLDVPIKLIRENVADLPAPDWTDPPASALRLADMLERSQGQVENTFLKLDVEQTGTLLQTMREMTDLVANEFYITSHPEVQRLIRALNASSSMDFECLFTAVDVLASLMGHSDPPAVDAARSVPLPDVLVSAVKGDVLAIAHRGGDWVVYGGPGPNEYDLSVIAVVIDAAGDDVYRYPVQERPSVQVVVDFAGNDQYVASESADGPGSAMLGVNLIVDHAGNDRYEGGARSCGVGIMGVGMIVDHSGADQYAGTRWSLGAAFYGLGAIMDLGGDSDVYTAHTFSQAIGGPRGIGLILDQNGRDLYRCNGPIPSGYGTAAVYAGISQGVGFGVRGYDTGGIGLLCDLGGDDRYEAGEFSQGGAYYWGLGVLYDRAGRDLYYGNRYGQAFAAHQALGVLADDGGDDTYWGMTAATQSGSWDICATLLIDRGGNDTYQADGLAQGGASMQAIAWLIDLDGTDRYCAPDGATQGQSGGNSYHYDETGCYSWSLLLDAGGQPDIYTRTNRSNGMISSTGTANEGHPADSGLHGLFIDTEDHLAQE